MSPEERGRAMYESAPFFEADDAWTQLTPEGRQRWIDAAAKYEERTRPPAKAYALRHPIEKDLWFVCYGDPGGDGEWSSDKAGRHEWWDGSPGSAQKAAKEMKKRLGFGDLIRVRS